MPITAEKIKQLVGENPNGVSVDLQSERVLNTKSGDVGFCVAYSATQNNHDDEGLSNSMTHAQGDSGSGIIGAWSHGDVVYYDSVKKYSTREAAVEAAKKEDQIAIYNIGTQTVESIKDGESFNPSLLAQRKRAHSI